MHLHRNWLGLTLLLAMAGTTRAGAAAASGAAAPKVRVLVSFHRGVDRGAVRGAGGTIHSEWPELRAVSAELPAAAVDRLRHDPRVEYVEDDAEVYPLTITGHDEYTWGDVDVRADVAHANGSLGTGVNVCVIDSGIDPGHPELAPVIRGGFDFVDHDPFPWDSKSNDCASAPCDWAAGHGTHVAGTIAAQFGHAGALIPGMDPGGVVGVAPGVSLWPVRVFGSQGGAPTSRVIDALRWCRDNVPGRVIVSMSLGGTQDSKTARRAFDSAYADGLLLVAAAGNDSSTVTEYPAGYEGVISVAAVDSDNEHAIFSNVNPDVELAAPGVGVLSTLPRGQLPGALVLVGGTRFPAFGVLGSALAEATAPLVDCGLAASRTSCADVSGPFIAFVDRGDVHFAKKVRDAIAQGAVGVVLADNDTTFPDLQENFGLGNKTVPVPVASVPFATGQAIRASGFGASTTVSVALADYAVLSGTSMATPHVTGCAALVWSAHPELTNEQVRARLDATARDLGAAGRDPEFGFGLVDCAAASAP